MVGTSLSYRLKADSIPFVCSLSFAGCSVEDGLNIILSRDIIPKYIIIESNFFFKESSPGLFWNISEGALPIIRKLIPSLREQYSPICLFHSFNDIYNYSIKPKFFEKKTTIENKLSNEDTHTNKSSIDMKTLNMEVERRILSDKPLPEDKMITRKKKLKGLIKRLEDRGATIVFFEMPVNERILHLKSNNQTREVLKQEFPPIHYKYLGQDTAVYLTNDGIHMNEDEAIRYSHFLKQIISEELSINKNSTIVDGKNVKLTK